MYRSLTQQYFCIFINDHYKKKVIHQNCRLYRSENSEFLFSPRCDTVSY